MSAGELVVVLEGVRIPLEAAAVVDLRQDEVVRVRFSPAVPLDLRTKKMAGLTSKVFQCLVDLKLLGLICRTMPKAQQRCSSELRSEDADFNQ